VCVTRGAVHPHHGSQNLHFFPFFWAGHGCGGGGTGPSRTSFSYTKGPIQNKGNVVEGGKEKLRGLDQDRKQNKVGLYFRESGGAFVRFSDIQYVVGVIADVRSRSLRKRFSSQKPPRMAK